MTFRTLVLLAILGVVVFTTAVSLLIAQRQNGIAYRTLGDELLDHQALTFQRVQQLRHAQASALTARLADSVRLFAALEAHDPAVYKVADDELRIGEFSFFRLLDATGELIEPPTDLPQAGGEVLEPALLASTARAAVQGDQVQLGFATARPGPDRPPRLYRVLAAPVRNFDRLVGTLLLGQRVTGLAEAAGDDAAISITYSALWLDGRLAGGNVLGIVRGPLAAALATPGGPDRGQLHAGDSLYRYQRTPLNPGSAYPPAALVSIFSMDGFVADQRDLLLRIVLTGAVASLLAGAVAFALARQLARPIGDLVNATRRIRGGDFAPRLRPSSIREFTTLAEAFNDMAADLALKERYHSVLQQVADRQVADELVAGRVKLGGELRQVTVMFCDIREYTAITRGRAPEAVIELLNDHFGALTRIVHAHRGVINQFAGDAIMALFGAPKRYGDDTERAVRCARAMMAERARLNRDAATPIQVGIGIASGLMVAGCIGAEQRSDYTVVGERVNLASRLAGYAAPGEILIDDETRTRLGDELATETLAPLTLKGFGSNVIVHRVPLEAAS